MKLFSFRKSNERSTEEEDVKIEGERAPAPSINKHAGLQRKATNIIVIGGVAVVGAFGLHSYYANLKAQKQAAKDAAQYDPSQQQQTVLPPLSIPDFQPAGSSPSAPPVTGGQQGPSIGADGQPILSPAERKKQRQLSSSLKFSIDSPAHGSTGGTTVGSSAGSVGAEERQASGMGDSLSASLQPAYTPGATATLLPHPDFMITKGTTIPCTVDPAIDSDLSGIMTCTGSTDVWSTNHRVKLMEAGTKYVGESKQAMANGQRRLAILWTRAETPKHVLIDLNSGTSDELGRSGIGGEVDNHFFDRFGAAIMLSMVSDLGQYAVASQQSGGSNGNTLVFPNTVSGSQDVVSEVLKQGMSIPPTLRRNQAANINIYVARDLDFSSVYDLEGAE